MLDDDAFPLPGAIEAATRLSSACRGSASSAGSCGTSTHRERHRRRQRRQLRLAARAGRQGPPPAEGFPAFFFPEGASFVRRDAYLESGRLPRGVRHGRRRARSRHEADRARLGRPLPADGGLRPSEDDAGRRASQRTAAAQGAEPGLVLLAPLSALARGCFASRPISPSTSSNAPTEARSRRGATAWSPMRGVNGRRCGGSGIRCRAGRCGGAELNRGRMHVRLLAGKLTEKLSAR